jgi:hypothetical protein
MATWLGNNVTVIGSTYARIRIETQYAGGNVGGNYSTVNYQAYIDFVGCDAQLDGGWVQSSAGVHYDNGGRVYNYAGNFSNHTVYMSSGNFNIGHDANGNGSYGMNAHIAVYQSGTSTASGSEGLPRLALAPGIASVIADTIKPTQARLGGEISDYGHGTSATLQMFIRLQGAGGWTDLGAQSYVGGYNFWTPTGLKPGRNYEYFLRVWNNSGDTRDSGVQSFRTKPVSGMTSIMKGII